MEEIWKDIKGYEGYYQVSNLGRIKSLDRYVLASGSLNGKRLVKSQIIKQRDWNKNNNGSYYSVNLNKNNKTKIYTVHRLVAQAFIPNPNNLEFVNHKDENKHNNYANNLEWCTLKYNNNYGTARKRGGSKIRKAVLKFDLGGDLLKRYNGLTEAAKEENVSKGNLANVCVNRNGKHTLNGYIFMYECDYKERGFIGYKDTKVRQVNQYDLNGNFIRTFSSIKEAYESTSKTTENGESNITAVCKHRQKSAYGYIWKYANEYNSELAY